LASRTPYSCNKTSFTIIIYLLLDLTLACGCSTPVGVKRVDPTLVHRDLTSNVLSTGKLSVQPQIVLNRNDLYKLFKQKPEQSIAKLQSILG